MAWHTIKDTQKLTGRSRSQLYRDMNSGLVSYRTRSDGRREFETSELIRAYGNINIDDTQKKDTLRQLENAELKAIRKQLDELKQAITLMLEDKTEREKEKQQRETERQQMQNEIARLAEELEQEKKRGLLSRIFWKKQ